MSKSQLKRLATQKAAPAPDPYGYCVYFPDEQRQEWCNDLDELVDDLTNCRHEITPLYAHPAPAERAERERDEALALLVELDKRLDDERSAEDRQLRWRIYELVKGDLNHSLGYATVWHDGSKSFYHAQLIRPMTAEEVQREAEGG